MTFRRRLTLVSAGAVAAAVAVAALAIWFIVRAELRRQVDASLHERAAELVPIVGAASAAAIDPSQFPPIGPGEVPVRVEIVGSGGVIVADRSQGPSGFPIPGAESLEPGFHDLTVRGVHLRVYSVSLDDGLSILVFRSLLEVDGALRRLGIVLLGVLGAGVAIAAGLGAVVTRTAVAPVARLTEAAERVSVTGDLRHRIDVPTSSDELGRLASTFNSMLEALDTSVGAQRQLVADASHELRTPLTSVRTNIEVLASGVELPVDQRAKLLSDVGTQLEELSGLVNDLVELARGNEPLDIHEEVRLDDVVREAIARAERRSPEARFELDAEPSVVLGDPARLTRAVGNLLDNATKWNPPGVGVHVSVGDGTVRVGDHGPGFEEADLPHVFDRFYRSAVSRGMPGSGLGLAIVRQIAEAHGGRAVAENAPDGGALVRLELLSAPQDPLTKGSAATD